MRSRVDEHVAWASGRNGTVLRTIDGGATWEVHVIPGAETLAFRDIDAFSKDVAFVLSNNNTPNARIYKTEDGGQTWTLQFQSPIAVSFYDCFAFWNQNAGIVRDPRGPPGAEHPRRAPDRATGPSVPRLGERLAAGRPSSTGR